MTKFQLGRKSRVNLRETASLTITQRLRITRIDKMDFSIGSHNSYCRCSTCYVTRERTGRSYGF